MYLWDVEGGFAGVVLLKKGTFKPPPPLPLSRSQCDLSIGNDSTGTEASWDSGSSPPFLRLLDTD